MNYDIEKLLKLREELDKVSDELTLKIQEFEADLGKLRLGVTTWTNAGNAKYKIGYLKIDKKWCIGIRYHDYEDGPEILTRLIDAPRNLRLHAYKHLHLLLPALEATAESLTRRITKALNDEPEETSEVDE